jgi:hypothetical protein
MRRAFSFVVLVAALTSMVPARAAAQEKKTTGELRFSGASKAIRDSGVWIDGQYVGYVDELRGDDSKLSLPPGPHHVIVRQVGFKDFDKVVIVESKQVRWVDVAMDKDPAAVYPSGKASELKLNIAPSRAAVFIDDGYIGHASDFGGYRIMVVSPGKHRVKVELPGYEPFETEVNPLPGQRTIISTGLLKGSNPQAGALINN